MKKTFMDEKQDLHTVEGLMNYIINSKNANIEDSYILDAMDKANISPEISDEVFVILAEQGIDIDATVEGTLEELDKEIATEDVDFIDASKNYIRMIGKIPLLTREEELKYAHQTKSENESEVAAAKEKLTNHNLKLVISIAKKYYSAGMQFDDLVQEGTIGLIKSIEKYDPNKGYKLSTYSTWWIRQAITRAIADQSKIVRVPVHMTETINKMNKAKQKLSNALNRDPSREEVAEEMGITSEKVKEIENYALDMISLELKVGEDDSSTLKDFLEDNTSKGVDAIMEEEYIHNKLLDILETLTPREKEVILMRYGMVSGKVHTLEEIGNRFDITRERVRQIELRAMTKLRGSSRISAIEDFRNYYD